MRKLLTALIFLLSIITACGPAKKVEIPEGTDPGTAQVMTDYNLNRNQAEALLNALENQSSLNDVKLSDITFVQERLIRGRRVLFVRAGNKDFYVNMD